MGDRMDFDGVSIGVGSTLFLTAAPNLTEGDELAGGQFGKRLARETSATCVPYSSALLGTHGVQALLELIWEVVRAREFSERPSRFDSLFLWHDEAEVRAWHYRQHVIHTSPEEVKVGLYEVEVRQIDKIWAGDMNLISYLNDGETLEKKSPVMPIRGTSPVLADKGQPLLFPPGCDKSTVFQIANPLSPGTPYRPVLICDRTAAHYWQLPQHWGGTLRGSWLQVSD